MKKTWRNIIIISLILVVLETVATMIIIRPYYKCQLVYNSISGGNWIEAQENYNNLSQSGKNRVQSYLPEYAAWLASSYTKGEISYEDTAASFDAINAIDDTKTLYDKYMTDISKNEYVIVIDGMHQATDIFDSKSEFEYRKTLNAIMHRLDNDSREAILVNMLNMKYDSYLNDEISVESMCNFYNLVIANSYYAAYDYAFFIQKNVDCVVAYRGVYENARVDYDEQRYFEAMELCKIIVPAPGDTVYAGKVEELYNMSYEAGKEYYQKQLDGYVAKGDKKGAVALMNKIETVYGKDFDLSSTKEAMAQDWQLAAIKLAKDWEPGLKKALGEFSTGEYILENEYNELKPDSILLYDVNGDMLPELFLFNKKRANNEYVECFMYAYVDDKYEFLDYINVKNFCSTSDIVVFPYAFERTAGDECMLVSFNGTELTYGNKCQEIGGVYYVNGEEKDDIDYLAAQTEILANINEKTVGNGKYSSLEEAEGYILAY